MIKFWTMVIALLIFIRGFLRKSDSDTDAYLTDLIIIYPLIVL